MFEVHLSLGLFLCFVVLNWFLRGYPTDVFGLLIAMIYLLVCDLRLLFVAWI